MLNQNFFSLSIKQPVNQWLCIGLMVSWTIWVVVHYVKDQIDTIATSNAQVTQELQIK
ncbi:MAG TPA: hypothetical protein VL335_03725 [Candidatus Paceibacterota bacterium]|nr:hypothetical protein [Candidatus Paceibacterota bacterium]